ncbi:MAG: hypothetical protein ACLQOZ_06770 [Acidimicrobiales bacterium]|jgi:hypothetical protein
MDSTWAGVLIIGGGLLVVAVVVALLVSSQRRRPEGGGWYAGSAVGTRRRRRAEQASEDYYDPAADPAFAGDGLSPSSDSLLRGDIAPPHPRADAPPATDSAEEARNLGAWPPTAPPVPGAGDPAPPPHSGPPSN